MDGRGVSMWYTGIEYEIYIIPVLKVINVVHIQIYRGRKCSLMDYDRGRMYRHEFMLILHPITGWFPGVSTLITIKLRKRYRLEN